jgi:protein TonB
MFDLIANGRHRTPMQDAASLMVSLGLHFTAVVALVLVPLLFVTESFPQVQSMMRAFVAEPPPPPPPPPPAPDASPRPAVEVTRATPVDAPLEIAPEPPPDANLSEAAFADVVPGGIVGGIASVEAPPLSSPPAEAPSAPVRIGGAIKQPALVSRVGPVYPAMAVSSHVEGMVILEAVVDREGRVEDVRILRSVPLLDGAAIDAVRQWRYEPLVVNGHLARFIVTVTVNFQLRT